MTCGTLAPKQIGVAPCMLDGTPSRDPPIAFSAPGVHIFFVVEQLYRKVGTFDCRNFYGHDEDLKERVELAMYLHALWTATRVVVGYPLVRPLSLVLIPFPGPTALPAPANLASEHESAELEDAASSTSTLSSGGGGSSPESAWQLDDD